MHHAVVSLRDVLILGDSGTWGTDGDPVSGSPVLRSTNIDEYRLDLGEVAWRRIPPAHRFTKRLQTGDILVTASSGSPEHIGKCCVFEEPSDGHTYFFSNFTLRLRAHPEKADPRWLYHWLKSDRGRATLSALNTTTSGLRNLNRNLYLSQKLAVPPLAEQRRIAAILDKADAIRRRRRESLRLLDEFLRSAFLEMFGDPVKNEKGWPTGRIGDFGHVTTGSTPPTDDPENYGDQGLPLVRPTELDSLLPIDRTAKNVSQRGQETVEILPAGTVLFCGIGATIGKTGYTGVPACVNQQIHAIVVDRELVTPIYLFMAIRLSRVAIVARATTTTLPILKKSSFGQYRVPVPPMRLLERYGRLFEQALGTIGRARDARCAADTLFDSLAQRAFRGA
jgi:type I restriction enzyme S subunit